MTDLLSRPRPALDVATAPAPPPPRPAALSAVLGALWSAAACLLACCALSVAAWLSGSTCTAPGAVRVGTISWLLAHGSGVELRGGAVSLVPLGITAVAGLLLYRSGRWVATSSMVAEWRTAAVAVGALVSSYAALVVGVTLLAAASSARPDPLRAGVGAVVLATACGGMGVLRASGLLSQLSATLPEQLRSALRGAVGGVLGMLAAGAVLVAASLLLHVSLAEELASSIPGGAAGVLLLALVGALLLPNAMLCAGALMLGPGFALGVDTFVTPTQVHLGQLPLLPLLAALPNEGAQGWWVTALVAVPVLVGGLAAVVGLRRYPVDGLAGRAVSGGLAGVAAGVAFGLLTVLAVASGPGRLSEIGPQPLACAVAAVAGMGVGGVLTGALSCIPLRGIVQPFEDAGQRLRSALPWRRSAGG